MSLSLVFSTREIDPRFSEHIRSSSGLKDVEILPYVNRNKFSLAQLYNRGLIAAKHDIVVFVHDDIAFDRSNWGNHLLRQFRDTDFGILGVAGTTELIMDGEGLVERWWKVSERRVGYLRHRVGGKYIDLDFPYRYRAPIEVICLDGVFIAVDRTRIRQPFDERFGGFHYYDLSFTFSNHIAGVRVGVTFDVRVTHHSIGVLSDDWYHSRRRFTELYGGYLPHRIPHETGRIRYFDAVNAGKYLRSWYNLYIGWRFKALRNAEAGVQHIAAVEYDHLDRMVLPIALESKGSDDPPSSALSGIFAVVLNWNRPYETVACVESLCADGFPREHVLLIDNCSQDDSWAIFALRLMDVRRIRMNKNHGFAGGMNEGIRFWLEFPVADRDLIWCLNNDTTTPMNGWQALLQAVLDVSNAGLVSPLIVDVDDGSYQFVGSSFDWEHGELHRYPEPERFPIMPLTIDSERIVGTAVAAQAGVWKQVGLFDESLFAYWEDDDLSVRSTRAGFTNVVVPGARIFHTPWETGIRSPHYFFYMKRNEYLFWKTYLPRSRWRAWQLRYWVRSLRNIGEAGIERQRQAAIIDGCWCAIRNIRGEWVPGIAPRAFDGMLRLAPFAFARVLFFLVKFFR